jgi:hypothetical protein
LYGVSPSLTPIVSPAALAVGAAVRRDKIPRDLANASP